MAELTKEAECREIAERHGLKEFDIDGMALIISNNQLAALREAYDAGAKAQREEDSR